MLFTGCGSRDPLEEAAWQASRVGTAAGEGRGGRDTVGLDTGAQITERFYYVAKYQASQTQRQVAESVARRVAPKAAAKARAKSKPAPRYIAVRTRSDARAKTKTSVMVWDTRTEEIVGNDVYDLNDTPPSGAQVKFETYSAQFVAVGS